MRKVLYILGQLSDADVEWLSRAGVRARHAPGAELIRAGAPLDRLYLILDGEAAVRTGGGTELARVAAGEILGEMSFVESRPASASVVVTREALVLEVPRAALQARLDADPAFGGRFYRSLAILLSDRLRGTSARLGQARGEGAADDADELDGEALDQLHLAGARFEALLRKLAGAA